MKKGLLITAFLSLMVASCANQPHQSTQVVDDRPQVSFVWSAGTTAESATLYVDGQSFGAASQYLYPDSSVPVLVGEHLIEIKANNTIIFSEKRYFGENQSYQMDIR